MLLEPILVLVIGYYLIRRRGHVLPHCFSPVMSCQIPLCFSTQFSAFKVIIGRINCARGRWFVFSLTFCCYAMFHACRKPLSVVKNILVSDCHRKQMALNSSCNPGWAPFSDTITSSRLLGMLDSTFLFSYAVSMFISGHVAERTNKRLFLSAGMLLSGGATIAFGLAYFMQVHDITFFLAAQMIGGAFQSTGWPAVVAIMANWYGPQNRGLIMGIWNSHTLVGNMLGSVIAAHYVNDLWGFSFVVPGFLLMALALVVFLTLPTPRHQQQQQPILQQLQPQSPQQSQQKGSQPSQQHQHKIQQQTISPIESVTLSMDDSTLSSSSSSSSSSEAISFLRALKIPGIIHYSFALFFAKFVSYSLLFWLPVFLKSTTSLDSRSAALFSTFFDAGGIVGGVVAGVSSDHVGPAQTSVIMMLAALPALHWLQMGFHSSVAEDFLPIARSYSALPMRPFTTPTRAPSMTLSLVDILVLLSCGFFIQGPKTIITTTVSAALGEHPSLSASEVEDEGEEEPGEEWKNGSKDERDSGNNNDDNNDSNNNKDEVNVHAGEAKNSSPTKGASMTLSSKMSLNAEASKTTSTVPSEDSASIQFLSRKSSSSPTTSATKLSRKPSSTSAAAMHPMKALSTVTAIIDGSGSLGAALGPLLTGVVLTPFGWRGVVFMWILCNLAAALPLVAVYVADRRKKGER